MAKDLISDGLAVSYYFSFIEKIFKNTNRFPFEVINHVDDKIITSDISIDVILPQNLEAQEIEKCMNYILDRIPISLVVENGRNLNLFSEKPEDQSIKIVDLPTSFDALSKFLNLTEETLKDFKDLQLESKQLKAREREELDKFKSILEFLIENSALTRGKVKVFYLN